MRRAEVGAVIEARDLTKRYRAKVAVDHLWFTVQPGSVTGSGPERCR
jgi:ABC-2 type transport system ATP-binding protein